MARAGQHKQAVFHPFLIYYRGIPAHLSKSNQGKALIDGFIKYRRAIVGFGGSTIYNRSYQGHICAFYRTGSCEAGPERPWSPLYFPGYQPGPVQ